MVWEVYFLFGWPMWIDIIRTNEVSKPRVMPEGVPLMFNNNLEPGLQCNSMFYNVASDQLVNLLPTNTRPGSKISSN